MNHGTLAVDVPPTGLNWKSKASQPSQPVSESSKELLHTALVGYFFVLAAARNHQ
jgi:hypothetical protein